MRIDYLSSSTLISDSANAVHVSAMSGALCRLGHDVHLHGYEGRGAEADVRDYYNMDASVALIRYKKQSDEMPAWLGLLHRFFPFLRLGGLPALCFGGGELAGSLCGKSDLVFARNMYWAFGVRAMQPYIFESHSPAANVFQRFVERALLRGKNLKALVVISDKLADLYRRAYPDMKAPIIVAHDGADDPGQRAVALDSKVQKPFMDVGYVGHLYRGRGIEIILAAAELCPDLQFHIVGGQAALIDDFKAKGCPENVTFYGHLAPSSLPDFYKKFDAVLAPYQKKVAVHGNTGDTSSFMSPLKIFEYMSWGLPILCSDLPVLREVLCDGDNAMLLKPDDPQDWARALKALQQDTDLRQSLARKARCDFLQHYSWEGRAKRILKEAGYEEA